MNAYETVLSGQLGVRYAIAYNRDESPSPVVASVMLAAGALADIDLMGPSGYNGSSDGEIAEVTGLDEDAVLASLRVLTSSGALVRASMPDRFRLPESAFHLPEQS